MSWHSLLSKTAGHLFENFYFLQYFYLHLFYSGTGNVRSSQAVSTLFTLPERIRGACTTQICYYTSNIASATAIISGIRKIILLLMHKSPADTMLSSAPQGLGNGCKTTLSEPWSSSRVTPEPYICIKAGVELRHPGKSKRQLYASENRTNPFRGRRMLSHLQRGLRLRAKHKETLCRHPHVAVTQCPRAICFTDTERSDASTIHTHSNTPTTGSNVTYVATMLLLR